MDEARRRIAATVDCAGLLADQERLRAIRVSGEALLDRRGRESPSTLLNQAMGLLAHWRPALSCGLMVQGVVVAANGWEDSFRAWHEGRATNPQRCPLSAVGRSIAAIRVESIQSQSAESWREWRSVGLAHGRRSAMAVAIAGDRAALLVYSRNPAISDAESLTVWWIARLTTRLLDFDPTPGPTR